MPGIPRDLRNKLDVTSIVSLHPPAVLSFTLMFQLKFNQSHERAKWPLKTLTIVFRQLYIPSICTQGKLYTQTNVWLIFSIFHRCLMFSFSWSQPIPQATTHKFGKYVAVHDFCRETFLQINLCYKGALFPPEMSGIFINLLLAKLNKV